MSTHTPQTTAHVTTHAHTQSDRLLLDVQHLHKAFGGNHAVNDVSFRFASRRTAGPHRPQRRRQIHHISTWLTASLRPTAGSITFGQRRVHSRPWASTARVVAHGREPHVSNCANFWLAHCGSRTFKWPCCRPMGNGLLAPCATRHPLPQRVDALQLLEQVAVRCTQAQPPLPAHSPTAM